MSSGDMLSISSDLKNKEVEDAATSKEAILALCSGWSSDYRWRSKFSRNEAWNLRLLSYFVIFWAP